MKIEFEKLSVQWHELAAKAKKAEYISYDELLEIFRATHLLFKSLEKTESVPRKACQIIMLLDEFTYYATMADENYLGDIHSGLYYLNYALKSEFFNEEYQSEFFMGATPTDVKKYVLDIDNISLDDFIRFLKDETEEDYNEVVLA